MSAFVILRNRLKEIWESPRVKEDLTSLTFEPTISELDLPMFDRLSYEASAGADRVIEIVNRGIFKLLLGIQLTFTRNAVAFPCSPIAFTKKKQSVLMTCIFNLAMLLRLDISSCIFFFYFSDIANSSSFNGKMIF